MSQNLRRGDGNTMQRKSHALHRALRSAAHLSRDRPQRSLDSGWSLWGEGRLLSSGGRAPCRPGPQTGLAVP